MGRKKIVVDMELIEPVFLLEQTGVVLDIGSNEKGMEIFVNVILLGGMEQIFVSFDSSVFGNTKKENAVDNSLNGDIEIVNVKIRIRFGNALGKVETPLFDYGEQVLDDNFGVRIRFVVIRAFVFCTLYWSMWRETDRPVAGERVSWRCCLQKGVFVTNVISEPGTLVPGSAHQPVSSHKRHPPTNVGGSPRRRLTTSAVHHDTLLFPPRSRASSIQTNHPV